MGGDLNICGDVTQEEFNSGSFIGLYKAEISQIWNENTSIIHFSPFNYWWGGCESRSRATVEASPSGRKLYEIGKILPSLNPLMSRTTVMLVWKQQPFFFFSPPKQPLRRLLLQRRKFLLLAHQWRPCDIAYIQNLPWASSAAVAANPLLYLSF